MSLIIGKKLPENCLQCGKAKAGSCPYHMGESRDSQLRLKLVRGTRKLLHLDGRLPDGNSLPPNVIVLTPTLDCNLSCVYCFQRSTSNAKNALNSEKRLDISEWLSIVNEIKSLRLSVIVMGGELFLYPKIMKLLRAIKEADLQLTVITNGFDLSKFSRELVDIGLDRLTVSLDGPAEVHNKARNHPKSYQLATDGIHQVLADRGICSSPFVQVNCTISTLTQSYLYDFVNAVAAMGVDRIVFNSLIYATAEQISTHAETLREDFEVDYSGEGLANSAFSGVDPVLVKKQLSAIRTGPWTNKVFVSPPGVEQNLEVYFASPSRPFQKQFCTAIYRELWILPDGNVAACGHLPDLIMGNVGQSGVMAVWNGERFRHFRQRLAHGLLPACGRCEKLTYGQP